MGNSMPMPICPTFRTGQKILIFLREENKVVYQVDVNIDHFDTVPQKSEIPIYDFNVEQAGDTMWAWHNDPPYFGMEVEWIDTILVNNTYRETNQTEGCRWSLHRGYRLYRQA